MFKNYLIIAMRNLIKNNTNSLISITGLAIGLAASVAILIISYSELTWDNTWRDAERIFEIEQVFTGRQQPRKANVISSAERKQLEEDIPEIEYAGRMMFFDAVIKRNTSSVKDQMVLKEKLSQIDADIINIFNLKAIKGSLEEFYTNRQVVIISERMAEKYFGSENPIGKIIDIKKQLPPLPPGLEGEKKEILNTDYKVIGVIANTEKRTSLQESMDFLIRDDERISGPIGTRMFSNGTTYVKLKIGANLTTANKSLVSFVDRHMVDKGNSNKTPSELYQLKMINIKNIHLHGFGAEKRMQQNNILYTLASIILLLACINYVNLTTAGYSSRQKEIALRKTLGASRAQIVAQFLVESTISALIALFLTFIIIEPIMPWLGNTLQMTIELNYFSDIKLLGFIIGITLFVGLISGIYPGLYLSQVKPAIILKANKSHETLGSIRLRYLLVLVQFFIAGVLLSSMGVITAQLHALLNYSPGYATKNIVFITDDSLITSTGKINTLKRKILSIPGVLAVSKTMPNIPGSRNEIFSVSSGDQKPEDAIPVSTQFVFDVDEINLFNIPLIVGEPLPLPIIDGNRPKVIINQQALIPFGFTSADEALGKQLEIQMWGEITSATIIGITSELHMGDQNKPSGPVIIMRPPTGLFLDWQTVGVRFQDNIDRNKLVTKIKEICNSELGSVPHEEYIEDITQRQYANQIMISHFIYIFTALAIFISCLGLYGLAAFTAKKRTKEIGLRKIHGASVNGIMRLLVWQFTVPVLLANIFAWPIALYLMNYWLENFYRRLDLWAWGPLYCLLAGALSILIAWLTIGGHSLKVARAKPVNALREE
jgi:putative ABC transport system permease protein